MKYISILLAINILLNYQNTNAQNTNCAVNAGVSANWCFGQDIQLKGNVAGEIVPNSILWTQISGPAVIITNANQLNASIKSAPAGNYEFNLSVQCTQGKTSQNVTQVVFPEIIVDAGPDITLDCYDMSPIPLTGFAFPPAGYVTEWKINPLLGSITNNVLSPNQSVFIRICDQQKKDTVFTLDFSYFNPQTGCKYSTKKKIYFRDYIIPMKIASNQACPEKLEDFAALVNCSGISAQSGQWSFVSPINGGGASFVTPNSTFSAFNNLKPNSTYIIKWTVTTNCGGTRSVFDTMKTVLKRPLAPFSKSQDIRYFCLPPDSIILVPPRFPDISKGEIGKWVFVDGNEYNDLPQKALDAYGKVHPIFPYTYDSLRVPITGFTPGFAYEFRYTIDNGVCQVVYSQFIIVLGIKPSQTEFLANKCGQGFESQCIKQGKYCFFKPFITLFIQGTEEKFYYRSPPKLISAPPGVTTKSIDLQNESTTFTVNQNIPYGFYVFMVVGDTSVVQEKCLQPFFYQIDLSEYPLKANAGTDVLICSTSTELPGNAVKFPNWYLLDRTPASAAAPIISGDSTANLKINGLSTDATYRFLYRSWGGRKCESLFDTVIVRTAFQTPATPNLGADFTACANGTITLTAMPAVLPGGVEGFWSLVNQAPSGAPPDFNNKTGTSTTVGNLLRNTSYTFRFTVRNGCGSAFDEIMVNTSNDIGPDQPNAGRDQCLSAGSTKALLVASQPSPSGASGQWSALSTNPTATSFDTPNNFSTLVNGLSEGKNYSFVYTVNYGICRSMQDTIVVSVGTTRRANIADSVLVFCNSKIPASIVVHADPSVGKWSQTDGVPGAIITEPLNPTTSINNLEAGSYRFKWSVKDGACDGGADEVVIHIGAATPIVLLGKDSTLCGSSNGILQLNAPTPRGFTGYWTFEEVAPTQPSAGAFFIQNTNPAQYNAVVQLKPGKTRLRWSLVPLPPCNNLPSYDDILVEYIPNADAGKDTLKFCDGKLIELKANQIGNNTSGIWTQISGTTIPQLPKVQQGDNPIFLQLKAAGIYQFRFTINSTTCPQSSDEVTVINYELPNFPDIGTEDTICVKDAILLNANVLPPGYEAKWTINKMPAIAPVPAFAPNNQSQKVRVTNLVDGKYQFQYTITNGVCTLADVREDTIHINTINAGPDFIICRDTVVQLGPAANNLQWSAYAFNPTKVSVDSKTGRTGKITLAGEYYFFLTDNEGCSDDIKITKKAANSILSLAKDITICPGNTAVLNADIQIATTPFTIQWQSRLGLGQTWQDIAGATMQSYTTPPLLKQNTITYYRMLLSDPACGNDTSGIFSVKTMTDFALKKNHEVCNLDDGNGNHLLDFSKLILSGDTLPSWNSLDAAEPPGTWSQKNFSGFAPNKTYRFIATTTNAIAPCANVSDTVSIFVKACCPKLCTDTSKIVSCNGLNVNLDLSQLLCNNTASGTWTYISGPTASLPISSGRFVNPIGLAAGRYNLKYSLSPTAPGSCPNETTHYIEIKKSPNSGKYQGKIEVCQHQDTLIQFMKLLSAADTGGIWTTQNLGIIRMGDLNPKDLKAGVYALTYTVKGVGGCVDASTSINLKVIEAPIASAGADQKITCTKPTAEITGAVSANTAYSWINATNQTVGKKLKFETDSAGIFYLLVKDLNTGCVGKDTVIVTVADPIISDINLNAKQPPCDGEEKGSILINAIAGGAPPFKYYINGRETTEKQIINLVPGEYSIKVVDSNGCSKEKKIAIENRDNWTLSLLRDSVLEWGEDIRLLAILSIEKDKISQVKWFNNGVVFDTAIVLSQIAKPNVSTAYEILVFDKNGCKRSARVFLQVKFDPKIYAPNVFSPNDDGINDRFRLYPNKYIKSIHRLDIYDRWGEWIFNQGYMDPSDPLMGWDGNFRDQPMNNAVFVWVAEVEFVNGEKAVLKGDVLLLR